MLVSAQECGIRLDQFPNPRQQERMRGFIHLVDTAFHYQRRLDAGERPRMQLDTIVDDYGYYTDVTMPITQRVVTGWINTALDLVNGFRANPTLHTAASEYLQTQGAQLKQEREERAKQIVPNLQEKVGAPATEEEINKLNILYNAGNDELI